MLDRRSLERFHFIGEQRCLDFINTEIVDGDATVDLLTTFDDLVAWSVGAHVVDFTQAKALTRRWKGTPEAEHALGNAIALRAVLRGMVQAMADGRRHVAQAVVDRVNDVLRARAGQLEVLRTKTGYDTRFRPRLSEPGDLLAPIAESAALLLSDVDPTLVRKCQNPRCILYFHDTTKNHRRRWCSMTACGNRAKVAAHYRRSKD